jgi:hypothetical protein
LVDVHPDLGGPYMQDWNTVMQRVLDEGAFRFTREWFAGRLPLELAQEPARAARQQLQFLVDQLGRDDWQGCTVGVTHDWNILLIRRFFLDLDASDVGWPDYLEGVVASLGPAGLELRWGDRLRSLRLPLPEQLTG